MPLLDVLVYFPNNSPTEVGLLGHGSLNLKVFIDTGTLPSIMVMSNHAFTLCVKASLIAKW